MYAHAMKTKTSKRQEILKILKL